MAVSDTWIKDPKTGWKLDWSQDDKLYEEILKSPEIKTSDPAKRPPLTRVSTGSGMRETEDKSRTCEKCKFGAPDHNVHTLGQCVAIKNKVGAIWTRRINDYYNMTCDLFAGGDADWRDFS